MATPPKEKRRFPRLMRPAIRAEAGGESFGWAVSYSDLLMVLLAFFLLYFQFGAQESASILNSIVRDLDSKTHSSKASSQEPPTSATGGGITQLSQSLAEGGFALDSISTQKGTITVNFPDGFFQPGQYEFKEKQKSRMAAFLDLLSPYTQKVDLVFIGHTDTAAIRDKTKVIDSNLILSNLRGARAVEFAILKGFDPRYLASEGVGQHRRASRSLSVRIGERK